MSGKKIIAVVGATGAQGSGLVRAILEDAGSEFTACAITRNGSSAKARELAALGADVVEADLDRPESVRAAFEGAYGAFCVTFFWDHYSPEKEQEQAKTMAAAARDAKLQHVIWSTLEDTRLLVPLSDDRMPTIKEKYKVPHLDGKGEADRYFAEAGVPTTYLLTSFYWDNFIHFGMGPSRGADGKLAITLPMGSAPLPGMAAADIGRAAYGIFKRGPQLAGKRIGVAGEHLTGAAMAAAFSTAIGEEVVYNDVDPAVYRGFGFPGADDLGNMFQYKRDFNAQFCAPRDLAASRELNPQLQTFGAWLAAHRDELKANL